MSHGSNSIGGIGGPVPPAETNEFDPEGAVEVPLASQEESDAVEALVTQMRDAVHDPRE